MRWYERFATAGLASAFVYALAWFLIGQYWPIFADFAVGLIVIGLILFVDDTRKQLQ